MASKKKTVLFVFMVFFLVTSDCYGYPNSPEIVTREYLKSLSTGNFGKAYEFISKSDQRFRSYSEFKGNDDLICEIRKKIWSLTKWEITSTKIYDGRASVSLIIRAPNIGEIIGRNLGMAFANIKDFNDEWEAIDDVKRLTLLELDKDTIDYHRFTDKMELIFEEGQWKILFHWEKKEKIRLGIINAIKLSQENRTDEAIEQIKKVLEIDKENEVAKRYLEILNESKQIGSRE